MSEAAVEKPYTAEQHTALVALADALGRFGYAVQACAEADLPLAEALTACGIAVPGWAGPMLESSLGSLAPPPTT